MEKKSVIVGVANQNETSMKVDDIKDWEPKKVSYIGTSTYFQVVDEDGNGTFYSMESPEFREIFGHKIKR